MRRFQNFAFFTLITVLLVGMYSCKKDPAPAPAPVLTLEFVEAEAGTSYAGKPGDAVEFTIQANTNGTITSMVATKKVGDDAATSYDLEDGEEENTYKFSYSVEDIIQDVVFTFTATTAENETTLTYTVTNSEAPAAPTVAINNFINSSVGVAVVGYPFEVEFEGTAEGELTHIEIQMKSGDGEYEKVIDIPGDNIKAFESNYSYTPVLSDIGEDHYIRIIAHDQYGQTGQSDIDVKFVVINAAKDLKTGESLEAFDSDDKVKKCLYMANTFEGHSLGTVLDNTSLADYVDFVFVPGENLLQSPSEATFDLVFSDVTRNTTEFKVGAMTADEFNALANEEEEQRAVSIYEAFENSDVIASSKATITLGQAVIVFKTDADKPNGDGAKYGVIKIDDTSSNPLEFDIYTLSKED